MDSQPFESMTVAEVGDWLSSKGFSVELQDAFKDQDMDGEAIVEAFATCSGPDCLKDVVSKYGQRVKVYNSIKVKLGESYRQVDQFSPPGSRDQFSPPAHRRRLSESPMSVSQQQSFLSEETNSPNSPTSESVTSRATSSVTTPHSYKSKAPKVLISDKEKSKAAGPPDPFPIPTFKEDTEESLQDKKLTDNDRKYMVRVLATVLQTYVQRPSMKQCEVVGKSLLRKYPFLKEYDSWTNFIYSRCQNVNRKTKDVKVEEVGGGGRAKKAKMDHEKHSYPSLTLPDMEDNTANERNVALLKQESEKPKPAASNIISLMTRTFQRRRQWILDRGKPVKEIIAEYPCLRRVLFVAHELDLILQAEGQSRAFEETWERYCKAVVEYAQASKSKSKDLKNALRDCDEKQGDPSTTALRCLAYYLHTKSKKRVESQSNNVDIPFLVMEVPRGTPSSEAIDRESNQPHIVRFVGDVNTQYFLAIEQELVIECRSMTNAIFTMLAVHFVFNIEYNHHVKDVLYFLQEKVLGIPDPGFRKSSLYMSISSAIDLYLHDDVD